MPIQAVDPRNLEIRRLRSLPDRDLGRIPRWGSSARTGAAATAVKVSCRWSSLVVRSVTGLHAGDQLLDPLVHRPERVLAQHGPLGLVVQLQVHPVHGEVTAALLGPAD